MTTEAKKHPGIDAKFGEVTATEATFHEGEPVFVLRGQDANAIRTIARYRNDLAGKESLSTADKTRLAELDRVINTFSEWAVANPKLVKEAS